MAYVIRDENDKIVSVYARPQDYASEYLDDDNSEIVDFHNQPETYIEKRLKSIADGGYGTVREQLEMIGEDGVDAFQSHVAAIKINHPKS